MSTQTGNTGARAVNRRMVVKGAAWSTPVIASVAAAPAFAASRVTYRFTTSGSGTTAGTCSFVLPPTATNITYSVSGGNGGRAFNPGGSGALLQGTLTPPATAVAVDLVAGGAGRPAPPLTSPAATYEGGQGWGNGGSVTYNATPAGGSDTAYGSSGGAGSAIVIEGIAAVVAGGGGGSGHRSGPHVSADYSVGRPPSETFVAMGGNAATTVTGTAEDSTDATLIRYLKADPSVISHSVRAGGGRGAGATGGAGGTNALSGTFSTTTNGTGLAGFTGSTTAGGNGANGRNTSFASATWGAIPVTSGGGGGGFSGGGSGGYRGGQYSEASMVCAGGGGGGSNYVATTVSGVAVTNTSVGLVGRSTAQVPGVVTVQFQAPPGLDLTGTCGVVVP